PVGRSVVPASSTTKASTPMPSSARPTILARSVSGSGGALSARPNVMWSATPRRSVAGSARAGRHDRTARASNLARFPAPCFLRSIALRLASEQLAELVLRVLEHALLLRVEPLAGAVDVEGQHRHRRSVRVRL